MDWIRQTIQEFGAARGLDGLEFDPDSVLELSLQNGELLGFAYLPELAHQEVLVYVSMPLGFDPLRQLEMAMRLSNGRRQPYGPVQTGIQDGRLTTAMHLPARGFDLPSLEQSISGLLELQQRAAQAV